MQLYDPLLHTILIITDSGYVKFVIYKVKVPHRRYVGNRQHIKTAHTERFYPCLSIYLSTKFGT